MRIFYLLSVVFSSNTDTNILVSRIMYESFLNIDSLIFLVKSKNMSLNETKHTVEKIIFPIREYFIKIKSDFKNPNSVKSFKDIVIENLNRFNSLKPTIRIENNNESNKQSIINKNNKLKSSDRIDNFENSSFLNEKQEISQTKESKFFSFSNFSLNGRLENSVNARKDLFSKDKSNIARKLYNDFLEDIINDLKLARKIEFERSFKEIDLNNEYIKMIEHLYVQIMENKMITNVLKREKESFYSKFKDVKSSEYKNLADLRMRISLSGSILSPRVLLNILKTVKIDDLEKNVNKILRPIETLFNKIKNKSNSEKRYEILTFLRSCLKREDNFLKQTIEDAFNTRAEIIQHYIKNKSEPKKEVKRIYTIIDKYGQKEANDLLDIVSKLREKDFENLVFLPEQAKEQYIKYLKTDDKNEKEELKNFFRVK